VTPSNFGLILVATIVVLAVLAKRFSLPYPIVFVVGGGFLAFFPHLPGMARPLEASRMVPVICVPVPPGAVWALAAP